MPRLRAGIAVVLALVVVSGVVSLAQRFGVFEGAGAGIRVPPRDFHDGRFTICKWMFRSDGRNRAESVGAPTIRLAKSTFSPESRNLPTFASAGAAAMSTTGSCSLPTSVVRVSAADWYGRRYCRALEDEVQRLREDLLKGGFLWVDDFWGTRAWDQWAGLITRVLPEFPIVDVAPADPIRHALFNITEVKQVPSIFAWGGPGSDPRERGRTVPRQTSAPSPMATGASWWR